MAWITIALCTVLLVGHVRAAPLGPETTTTPQPLNLDALSFNVLRDITCRGDVRFTSPTNVNGKCLHSALGHFIKEFQKAEDKCVDDGENIPQAIEELERIYSEPPTACSLTTKDHENFQLFLDAAEDFAVQFKSTQARQ